MNRLNPAIKFCLRGFFLFYLFFVSGFFFLAALPSYAQQCIVDWSDVHQRIDGFGASSAYRRTWSTAQADMFFSTNSGIGLSLLRTRIAPGGTTIETNIMQMARDRGVRIWSTPWSPPATFKTTNANGVFSVNGGNFVGTAVNYQAYANQLASYVVGMKNTYGVNIYALSVQNEPDYVTTNYESCGWTGQQIHDFIPYLAGALNSNNVGSTRIMLPEGSQWSRNADLYTTTLNDSNVMSFAGVIAIHGYGGSIQTGDTAVPSPVDTGGKPLWETEVSTLNAFDGSISSAMYWAQRIHLFLTSAQVNAWHYWWLISGNPDNEGLTDTSGNPAKRMYVLGNFSRFVRPDFYRVGTVNNINTLISAYKDSNSTAFAIVAINTNNFSLNQTFNLVNLPGSTGSVTPWITSGTLSLAPASAVSANANSFTYALPAMSVVTFTGTVSNTAPNLVPTADQKIDVTNALDLYIEADDPDVPSQNLVFNILQAPTNFMLLGTTAPGTGTVDGHFYWQPQGRDAGTTNLVTISVTDNGTPPLSATNSFKVIVSPAMSPVIVAQPQSQTNAVGGPLNFTVAANGTAPLYYFWQKNGTNLVDNNFSGYNTSNLVFTNFTGITKDVAGVYSVIVSNACGSVTSSNAVLTVYPTVYTNLYSFNGSTEAESGEDLIQGRDGYFYGTIYCCGGGGLGQVFKITSTGNVQWHHTFSGSDGSFLNGGIMQGADGNLYGMTSLGGSGLSSDPDNYGYGVYFAMNTNGALLGENSFRGTNGSRPWSARLIQGKDNCFYGTTSRGGAGFNGHSSSGYGTIFKIATNFFSPPAWSFAFGASNGNASDLAFDPEGSLVQDTDGKLYGTTVGGGAYGHGTIFQISTNGDSLTTVFHFNGTNGDGPRGLFVQGTDGYLYGATHDGGAGGLGTVFKMTTSGTLAWVFPFNGTNGANPNHGLIVGRDGNFYGTTANGGAYNKGTVFQITPAGALTTLLVFNGSNGGSPQAVVQATDGNLYGVTENGGAYGQGVFYEISGFPPYIIAQPTNQIATPGTMASFSVLAGGTPPLSYQWQRNGTNLPNGGNISGATTSNLIASVNGTSDCGVYSVIVTNPTGSIISMGATLKLTAYLTTLASFNLTNGSSPYAGLVQGPDGYLYGTTISGGTGYNNATHSTNYNSGTIFRVNPDGTITNLYSFTDDPLVPGGRNPYAGLVLGNDGNFYGVTSDGPPGNNPNHYYGAAFRMTTNGAFTSLGNFTYSFVEFQNGQTRWTFTDGAHPYATLITGNDGNLYGTAYYGGTNYIFNYDGFFPWGYYDQGGGGAIFKLASGGTLTSLASFNGTNGMYPFGSLFQAGDGDFYGTTVNGGPVYGFGTVFRLTTNGTLTTLISFENNTNYASGATPNAGLIQANDGNLYGTTTVGGAYADGTIYRLTTNGLLTTLISFNGTNGQNPHAALMQAGDGNFYGTTAGGGSGGVGTVFQLTTNGTLTTLISFNGSNGSGPSGPLIQASDGYFYGTTYSGGANNYGTIFRFLAGPPAPAFQSVAKTNGGFGFSWNALPGQTYQIQYTTNLSSGNWLDFGSAIIATNGTIFVQDVVLDLQRFYRVQLLP